MKKLRILSIISLGIIVAAFFIAGETYKVQLEKDVDKPNLDHPFLPYAGIFLFGIPPSVAGIVSSFLKTTKSKILISCGIIGVAYVLIFIIAILMLNHPTTFGIPETYWDIEQ